MGDLLFELIELVAEVIGGAIDSKSYSKKYKGSSYKGNSNHWSNSYERPYRAKEPKPMYGNSTDSHTKPVNNESIIKALHEDVKVKRKEDTASMIAAAALAREKANEEPSIIEDTKPPTTIDPIVAKPQTETLPLKEESSHEAYQEAVTEELKNIEEVSTSDFNYEIPRYEEKIDEYHYEVPEVDTSFDDDPFTKEDPVNSLKLEILLLSYMFTEDDGKISGKEKKAIKKHFYKFKGLLSTFDINEIKSQSHNAQSLQNIRAFISQNNVSNTQIRNAINMLKDVDQEMNAYHSIITRIESSLLSNIGF